MKKGLLFMFISLLTFMIVLTGCGQGPTEPEDTTIDPTEGQQEDPEQEEQPADEATETEQVVLYFSDQDVMETYRVKADVSVAEGEQIEKAALEAWIDGPEHENLIDLLQTDVKVESIEEVDGVAHVSFSKEIQELNIGSSGEIMIVDQIAMIMEQFGFNQTQLLVEGQIEEALLGHLYTAEPIEANNPEDYPWMDEEENESPEIVLENEAFRIYEPAPGSDVKDEIVIRGQARVYEGTILYEFEDGHYILDEGFTTASEGGPGWGEFEIIIELDDRSNYAGRVFLFEESAEDGSRMHELEIPVNVKN